MAKDALLSELAGCGSAETLLAAILNHYPDIRAPVRVEDIARRVGITQVRDLAEEDFTSSLLVDAAGRTGIIGCATALSPQRRRFAIAHQLGHFLLRTQGHDGHCAMRELTENRRDTPHRKQEAQANRFAAGLLMPKPLMAASLDSLGKPAIAHVPMLASTYGVTIESAASRYVDVTPSTCAIPFIKNGLVHYARPSRSFPSMTIGRGDAAPSSVPSAKIDEPTSWLVVEARDWLVQSRDVRSPKVSMQVLAKKNGLHLVMLFINAAAERRADEEAEKYATERPSFGRGSDRR
ncbi:MAG: ImmA/IrrE family metallo-endopeptidase [Pseudomonadota bacterium]|jgi:IrrE N-terminal-like domain|uniref:ImmA/IrrE family metallo-endopeptidase n=1 Tax=Sphingobium yanoikuyae TaxID=13690 RepID=UPI00137854E2|nr:ImmA/IrrE family metallo-endopeptidase [Sphingobium yanoikuyae]NBB38516.1 ImmA/IrrE family metallo-endopeptidase [Sphingobium yanoikuyae]